MGRNWDVCKVQFESTLLKANHDTLCFENFPILFRNLAEEFAFIYKTWTEIFQRSQEIPLAHSCNAASNYFYSHRPQKYSRKLLPVQAESEKKKAVKLCQAPTGRSKEVPLWSNRLCNAKNPAQTVTAIKTADSGWNVLSHAVPGEDELTTHSRKISSRERRRNIMQNYSETWSSLPFLFSLFDMFISFKGRLNNICVPTRTNMQHRLVNELTEWEIARDVFNLFCHSAIHYDLWAIACAVISFILHSTFWMNLRVRAAACQAELRDFFNLVSLHNFSLRH